MVVEKHEDVVSSTYPDENEVISYQNEIYDEEHENEKLQNDMNRIPVTVFGERLHKKIIDEEKEEKRQRVLSKLSAETNIRKIPEEGVAESDKENGSQLSINNINEFNTVTWNSNLGNLMKDYLIFYTIVYAYKIIHSYFYLLYNCIYYMNLF